MLANPGHHHPTDDNPTDSIHNYYERLVLEQIRAQLNESHQRNANFMADVACVALNRLPPRYIRHDVDMTFFMSQDELAETEEKVTRAVSEALAYVAGRSRPEQ
ncbi:late competence development ComFB family protein [Marinimicrobium alkaliphilum]|uniref:late competence development ComFB family protein n=1 Tax=Marinimicrobium alkaliphilum TaxID=2202654 RepID=UPI000DB92F30|nr:late competence development ComFB family protein [Marinimicrobium alkaliphilum]